jgi:hypothetical protein
MVSGPCTYESTSLARPDVDAALAAGTIPNVDPVCSHIPNQGSSTADIHTVAGIDIAAYRAQYHHFTS